RGAIEISARFLQAQREQPGAGLARLLSLHGRIASEALTAPGVEYRNREHRVVLLEVALHQSGQHLLADRGVVERDHRERRQRRTPAIAARLRVRLRRA